MTSNSPPTTRPARLKNKKREPNVPQKSEREAQGTEAATPLRGDWSSTPVRPRLRRSRESPQPPAQVGDDTVTASTQQYTLELFAGKAARPARDTMSVAGVSGFAGWAAKKLSL